jgi:hypothetical protein
VSGPAVLSVEPLLEEAERETGLSDWGDDQSWRGCLAVLVDSINAMQAPVDVIEPGRLDLVRLLATRLRLVEDERRHPEVAAQEIDRPVIVIGLPRTGTTILFDLLALDPAARAPQTWEVRWPWPAPERESYTTDPRIAELQAAFDAMTTAAPEVKPLHPWRATLPEECNTIMIYHFASVTFWARLHVPKYVDWLLAERAPGVYRTHKRILQQLQWKGPRGRWTLKSPAHQLDLEGLLATYPDACLIQTHREPARSFASLASMVATLRRAGSRALPGAAAVVTDPVEVGRSAAKLWGGALERSTISRRDPRIDAAVLDIAYRDLVVDPAGTVRRIYERFDLPWSDDYGEVVEQRMHESAGEHQGQHRYTLEEFGLDEDELRDRFPAYRERFGDLLGEPVRTA